MELWRQMRAVCDDLVDEAAALAEPCSQAELEAFAARLSGLQGMQGPEIREHLAGLDVPGDFRHFRLTNLTTGRPSGGFYNCFLEDRITVRNIVNFVCCVARRNDVTPNGRGVWSATVALPIKVQGTLELGLRFEQLQ